MTYPEWRKKRAAGSKVTRRPKVYFAVPILPQRDPNGNQDRGDRRQGDQEQDFQPVG